MSMMKAVKLEKHTGDYDGAKVKANDKRPPASKRPPVKKRKMAKDLGHGCGEGCTLKVHRCVACFVLSTDEKWGAYIKSGIEGQCNCQHPQFEWRLGRILLLGPIDFPV